jgi:hypothetical protein
VVKVWGSPFWKNWVKVVVVGWRCKGYKTALGRLWQYTITSPSQGNNGGSRLLLTSPNYGSGGGGGAGAVGSNGTATSGGANGGNGTSSTLQVLYNPLAVVVVQFNYAIIREWNWWYWWWR